MAGNNRDYAPVYRFAVQLGDTSYEKVCFSRVSGLERTMEFEEISEGGYNESPHLVAVPHKRHGVLVLERGMAPVDSWSSRVRPGMWLGTWLDIVLLDEKGKQTNRRFQINDGLITKWEVSGLDAMGSQLLVEKLEIMHEGIQSIALF